MNKVVGIRLAKKAVLMADVIVVVEVSEVFSSS